MATVQSNIQRQIDEVADTFDDMLLERRVRRSDHEVWRERRQSIEMVRKLESLASIATLDQVKIIDNLKIEIGVDIFELDETEIRSIQRRRGI